MTPLEERLVRRLVESPDTMSRNRNFDAFEEAGLRRARRTARLLRHLLHQLEQAVEVMDVVPVVADSEDAPQHPGPPTVRVALHLRDPARSLERRVMLDTHEYRLLRELGAADRLPDLDDRLSGAAAAP